MLDMMKKVGPYSTMHFHTDDTGYIVWRLGTGENIELLHIHASERGRGYGRQLFYRMLDRLKEHPPYYSVFGFTRVGNTEAQEFYGALGFHLQEVNGLYKEGKAILFWAGFGDLLARMLEYNIRGRQ